jgi:hypothetical protein
MQYSIVELTVLYMVMSCLTYIQGFSIKVAIFGKYANFIEIHLKILRFNFVPINDPESIGLNFWKINIGHMLQYAIVS